MPLFFDNFVIPIFPGSADVFVRAATAATDGPLEARPLCLLLANMMMRAALSRSVASQQAAKTGTTLCNNERVQSVVCLSNRPSPPDTYTRPLFLMQLPN
jgi:hypothetical protein